MRIVHEPRPVPDPEAPDGDGAGASDGTAVEGAGDGAGRDGRPGDGAGDEGAAVRAATATPAGGGRTLATDVEFADGIVSKSRGLMFRSPDSFGPGSALVIPFDDAAYRGIHTVFVRAPIDVVWTVDSTVTGVLTLPAWRGIGVARADLIVELPAGEAEGVAVGDRLDVTAADEDPLDPDAGDDRPD